MPGAPARSRRRWAFRVAAVLLGLAPLLLAELALVALDLGRPADYPDPFVGFGAVRPLFVRQGDEYVVPPARRNFFAAESFPLVKPAGSKRVFVLGGSTVQGRPYSIPTSFATWLELALNLGGRRWDIVNCGGISYASYRLLPILDEILQHRPDHVVVMTGHNEFLEDRTYAGLKGGSWRRLAGRSRLFTLARHAVWGDDAAAELPAETDPMLDYHDSLKLYRRDDAWHAGVAEHFAFNLRAIARRCRRAEVPLTFVLPPSNLADQPPFKSQPPAPRTTGGVDAWESAVADRPRSAGAWYELGQACLAEARFARAVVALTRARDEDVCPLRMTTPLMRAMRTVAAEEGVPLLDVHALFAARTAPRPLGGSLLLDHVHPTIEGHQLIATALRPMLAPQVAADPNDAWGRHEASLPPAYFLKGQRELHALLGWTRGQADGPPADQRFGADRVP